MDEPRYVTYGTRAGFIVHGTIPVYLLGDKENHLNRALYMVAKLESPKYGTVQSYDGCGMSAGILHNTIYLPGIAGWGSLPALLSAIFHTCPNLPCVISLREKLGEWGWGLALDDGIHAVNGKKDLSAKEQAKLLRDCLSGVGGVTPKSGPQFERAKTWASLFSAVFSDPATFVVQWEYAKTWICGVVGKSLSTIYGLRDLREVMCTDLSSDAVDLALCFYITAVVNAPGVALPVLRGVLRAGEFKPEGLVRALGTKDYGSWKNNPPAYSRYSGFRGAAADSGLWDTALVYSLFPANL